MNKKRSKRARRFLAVSLGVLAAILLFLWYIGVFGGNVHAVTPGRVYRSAQLTGRNLDDVLQKDHIETVLNLRGGSMSDAWYRSELASCRQYGAQHVDVDMSARLLPAPSRLTALLYTFDHARYPILYHCQSGADRSGMVGALYLNIYQHVPLRQAEAEQLTWRYGHFSFGQTHAMNDFYHLYNSSNGGLGLRDWIVKRYPTIYAKLPANEKQSDTPSPSLDRPHVADRSGIAAAHS